MPTFVLWSIFFRCPLTFSLVCSVYVCFFLFSFHFRQRKFCVSRKHCHQHQCFFFRTHVMSLFHQREKIDTEHCRCLNRFSFSSHKSAAAKCFAVGGGERARAKHFRRSQLTQTHFVARACSEERDDTSHCFSLHMHPFHPSLWGQVTFNQSLPNAGEGLTG